MKGGVVFFEKPIFEPSTLTKSHSRNDDVHVKRGFLSQKREERNSGEV